MIKFIPKIKDLEIRGGSFIKGKLIGRTAKGDLYTGTAYYNNGDHAEIVVLSYPYGGGRILGKADDSVECTADFERFANYLKDLAKTSEYRKTIVVRALLLIIIQMTRLFALGYTAFNIARFLPTTEIMKIAVIALNIVIVHMTGTIKKLIDSEF